MSFPPIMQDHEKFHLVANEAPLLFSRELQMGEEKKAKHMTLDEAVKTGIIANQTLAYFIGRTYMFLKRVGLTPEVGAADAWRCQRIPWTAMCQQLVNYCLLSPLHALSLALS